MDIFREAACSYRIRLKVHLFSFKDKRYVLTTQLSLVDLAGSERSQRTGAAGDRIKEAGASDHCTLCSVIVLHYVLIPFLYRLL